TVTWLTSSEPYPESSRRAPRARRKESSRDPPEERRLLMLRDRPFAPMHHDARERTALRDDRYELVGVARNQVERRGAPSLGGEGTSCAGEDRRFPAGCHDHEVADSSLTLKFRCPAASSVG